MKEKGEGKKERCGKWGSIFCLPCCHPIYPAAAEMGRDLGYPCSNCLALRCVEDRAGENISKERKRKRKSRIYKKKRKALVTPNAPLSLLLFHNFHHISSQIIPLFLLISLDLLSLLFSKKENVPFFFISALKIVKNVKLITSYNPNSSFSTTAQLAGLDGTWAGRHAHVDVINLVYAHGERQPAARLVTGGVGNNLRGNMMEIMKQEKRKWCIGRDKGLPLFFVYPALSLSLSLPCYFSFFLSLSLTLFNLNLSLTLSLSLSHTHSLSSFFFSPSNLVAFYDKPLHLYGK